MKIRIGVGAAGASATPAALGELVASIDELRFDSIWLSEVLTGPVLDPVVGLAWAAAANPRVKLGTTMLLPGRNVLLLGKECFSKFLRPVELLAHHLQDRRCCNQCLHTRVPALLLRSSLEIV